VLDTIAFQTASVCGLLVRRERSFHTTSQLPVLGAFADAFGDEVVDVGIGPVGLVAFADRGQVPGPQAIQPGRWQGWQFPGVGDAASRGVDPAVRLARVRVNARRGNHVPVMVLYDLARRAQVGHCLVTLGDAEQADAGYTVIAGRAPGRI